ncbi:MAG: iron-containing alcohol dehydrogenase [Pseudomonadota bacterium]
MTLINYLSRVHFADGVLEEALWAELSRRKRRRPLVVLDPTLPNSEVSERVLAGLPSRSDVVFFRDCPPSPTEAAARRFAALYDETTRDCVIAFGGRGALEFAKVARLAVGEDRPFEEIARLTGDGDASTPDLFLAPRLSGFAAALTASAAVHTEKGRRAVLTTRRLIPTVAICDPTLGLGAGLNERASAGAEAIVSCVEPYLAAGYNPPADGIALDGLRRALTSLPRIMTDDSIVDRRELAAAGLNGALAQEKGPGVAAALINALTALSAAAPDSGSVARLILPGVLRIGGGRGRDARRLAVRDMLSLSSADCLAEGVEAFMKHLPLPASLSEMGVSIDELAPAARAAASDLTVMRASRAVDEEDLHAVLAAVY